jgi:hypothetical protein
MHWKKTPKYEEGNIEIDGWRNEWIFCPRRLKLEKGIYCEVTEIRFEDAETIGKE